MKTNKNHSNERTNKRKPIITQKEPYEMSNPYIPLLCIWAMVIMVLVELNEPVEPTECIETIQCDTIVKPKQL